MPTKLGQGRVSAHERRRAGSVGGEGAGAACKAGLAGGRAGGVEQAKRRANKDTRGRTTHSIAAVAGSRFPPCLEQGRLGGWNFIR
jgi:hypothetical protein